MPAPTIASFTPVKGFTGTTVTITGTGFTGTTRVELYVTDVPIAGPEWALDAYSFTVDSDTQITAVVPHFWPPNIPGSPSAFGHWRVTTPAGTANKGDFDYISPVFDTVTITPDPATVPADGSLQLTATGHYLYDSTVDITTDYVTTWTSDDIAVAMVNTGLWSGGLVFGRAGGSATITASVKARAPSSPLETVPTVTDTLALTVTAAAAPPADPAGRFLLAFDDPATEPYPAWTRIDDIPNLVMSYTIDRGRSYELDRTDTGRATVELIDTDGTLDPTNPGGPFYGKIRPSLQAALGRRDPVTGVWALRFRGFVEELAYETDPSEKLNRLTISLTDQFDRLSRAEMQPGQCGDPPPEGSEGQIFYLVARVEDRISRVLTDFGIPLPFRAVLPGQVDLWAVVYSPGESPLAAIQEAADGDFPGVSNVFCDRRGRICFHSRQAKFDPVTVAAASGGLWDYHQWKAGDGAAVALSPTDTAQIRRFGFSRGQPKIINSAVAYPTGTQDNEITGQLVADTASLQEHGVCSWSAPSLLTKSSLVDAADGLVETKRFASYYTANYKDPHDRVQDVTFRSLHPNDPGAAANCLLVSLVDIADSIELTVSLPGGGGFSHATYFVEGIHEDVQALASDYDDATVRLDLSPRALFATDPWT